MVLENLMWSLKSPRKMVAVFCMNPVNNTFNTEGQKRKRRK